MCCTRVSLLVSCMQVNSRLLPEKNQDIQQKSTPAKRDKTRGHKDSDKYLRTYLSSRWHFYQTNCMPNTIMTQGLDSTGTNNLTRLVAQCVCVLYHKAQLRELN